MTATSWTGAKRQSGSDRSLGFALDSIAFGVLIFWKNVIAGPVKLDW